jgi:lipopolysaccharide biosynthesis regulator YciM
MVVLFLGSVLLGVLIAGLLHGAKSIKLFFYNLRVTGLSRRQNKTDLKIETLFNKAENLLAAGHTLKAIPVYEKTLDRSPNHIGALIRLGNTLRKESNPSRALDLHLRAEEVVPNNLDVLYSLADDYCAKGIQKKEIETLEKILKLDSSSFRVLCRIRDVYLKSEEWELAVKFQKKLISKIKGKEEKESEKKLLCWCIYKIAIGYFNSGNFNTSITKFEQALRENRHCLAGYIMLGEAFLKIKNIKAALKSWKKGYINTKSPVCLIRMEKYYRESGQLGLMIKEYKEALKVPSNSRLETLSLLLGSLFLEENDPQSTIKVIEENIDHEKNIVSSVLLADAYKKQNKNAVSEKFLEKISQQIKGKILSFKCGSCGREVDEWESICLVCNAFDEIRCLPETKS